MPTHLNYNTLAVFFDECSNGFQYSHMGNENIIVDVLDSRKIADFYAIHSNTYHILPEIGSSEYYSLIAECTKTEEQKAMTLAQPPDEFSIVISYDEYTDLYHINTPYSLDMAEESPTLENAYMKARKTKASLIWSDNNKPWKVWPRKGSNAYTMLVGKLSVTSNTFTFMDIFNELKLSLNSTNEEAEVKLHKVTHCITKNRKHLGFNTYSVLGAVNRYIKFSTGTEYVIATYNLSGNVRLVHPDNVKRVYSNFYKKDEYQNFTKFAAANISKDCIECSEAFRNANLAVYKNKAYCYDCMEDMSMYKCSMCSNWHSDDDGCPIYHQTPYETIHGYSVDVRKIIHKMYSTPTDKKINGEFLRYGIELEVLPKNTIPSKTARYNCGKALHNYALLKSDSSLGREGFEIVTVPATLEFHRTRLWHDFFNTTQLENLTAAQCVQSWHTNVCGIHVHVTRAAMTEMQLSKLLVFYHETYNSMFLSRIAGRKVGYDSVYCKAAKKKLRKSVARECTDHHGAITISSRNNGKTAEIRIFRGNATYHGVIRAVEFVDATVKWCGQNTTTEVLDYRCFLNWFNQPTVKSQYPELRKHLIDLKYLQPKLKEGKKPHPKATLDVVTPELKQA